MAGTFRGVAGGILSLAALIERYPQAIKADLIDRGLRLRDLGTEALTWDDLNAVLTCLLPDAALARAINPQWVWGLPEMLAADIADSLRWLVWAKTKDAAKGRNQPKPIPRPGVKQPERIGTRTSVADMNKFLGWEVPK